jgi:hypothetical protein
MDYRVERLRTPAECESFAKNAMARNHPDLAIAARRKALDLQAATHQAGSLAEAEAFAAVYAYEMHLTHKNGRKTRATKTWAVVKSHGIIEAVQQAVNRTPAPDVAAALRAFGLHDLTFEAVVVRHAAAFSSATVELSKARLAEAA